MLDAGTVTIEGDSDSGLVVISAVAGDGWDSEIDTEELGEAGVNFRNGDDRVDFRAETTDESDTADEGDGEDDED